jgi:hypothetical protein
MEKTDRFYVELFCPILGLDNWFLDRLSFLAARFALPGYVAPQNDTFTGPPIAITAQSGPLAPE